MKIVIIDYGMGNLHSLKSAITYINSSAEIQISNDNSIISNADIIFLPGVGHFKAAMDNLHFLNLPEILTQQVLNKKVPIMGICLGMQLLFKNSSEGGQIPGLGFIDSEVREISKGKEKVPHIGFNTVIPSIPSNIFNKINNYDFYFVHSYCIKTNAIKGAHLSYCEYNDRFLAAIEYNHIWGTQFHPEKSQVNGLRLINNFLNFCAN